MQPNGRWCRILRQVEDRQVVSAKWHVAIHEAGAVAKAGRSWKNSQQPLPQPVQSRS